MGRRKGSKLIRGVRERSELTYRNATALNWGESIEGRHFYIKRYSFNWQKVSGADKELMPLNEGLHQYILDFKVKNELAGRSVKVFVGTDSQNHLTYTRFVTVICLQVERNGVHVLVNRMDLPKIYDYRYRLLKEADVSAEFVRDNLAFFKMHELPFEIHCDYNSKSQHKSNIVVSEAMNYFNTMGIKDIKIKSEAIGASYAADHFC